MIDNIIIMICHKLEVLVSTFLKNSNPEIGEGINNVSQIYYKIHFKFVFSVKK